MTVICRIQAHAPTSEKGGAASQAAVVVIELKRRGSEPQRLTIPKTQTLQLNLGDRLKCLAGAALVVVNPGTGAGVFLLCEKQPPGAGPKYRTELVIDPETTRVVHRGRIQVAPDIGALSGGALSVR